MSKEKYTNEKDLVKKMDAYFKWVDTKTIVLSDKMIYKKPYTISGLCLYLDISKVQFYENYCLKYPNSTTRARNKVENYVEEGSLSGLIPTKAAEFNLKNNFKWQDKSIIEQTNKTDLSNIPDEELERRIKELKK